MRPIILPNRLFSIIKYFIVTILTVHFVHLFHFSSSNDLQKMFVLGLLIIFSFWGFERILTSIDRIYMVWARKQIT
jgi:hypothetical protein